MSALRTILFIPSVPLPGLDFSRLAQFAESSSVADHETAVSTVAHRIRGFIGRNCSLEHFGVDHAFARAAAARADKQLAVQQAARADKQLAVQQAADRLLALLRDEQLRTRLHEAFKNQLTLAQRLRSVRKQLPTSLLNVLHEMAKANRNNLVFEFERRELIENKEGKEVEVSRWESATVGVLSRPNDLDLLALDALAERFRQSKVTFDEAQATTDQLRKHVVAWARAA